MAKPHGKDVEAAAPAVVEVEDGRGAPGRRTWTASSSSSEERQQQQRRDQQLKGDQGEILADEIKGSALATSDGKLSPAVAAAQRRGLTSPEFLRNVTPEQRAAMEKRLVRKIDLRLMPCVVIMYIMNYLDRYAQPK